jgi:hypothetical protein
MEIVKNLFKNPLNINLEQKKFDTPLSIIEEQIIQLENINFSPIPETKEAQASQKVEIQSKLKKIIFNFDTILMNKIKYNPDSGRNFKTNEAPHYWNIISKYFHLDSVKFLNNIYEKPQTKAEKGLSWIYLCITEKSFYQPISDFYKQAFNEQFYESDAMINIYKDDILSLTQKLTKFHFSVNKTVIEEQYEDYRKKKELERKDNEDEFVIPKSPFSEKISDKISGVVANLIPDKETKVQSNY